MSRIHRTGQDNTWSAPMTDMQRERAEAPFADEFRGGMGFVTIVIGAVVVAILIMAWVANG